MTKQRPFNSGKHSSAILTPPNSNQTGDTVEQFMKTSFYLPVDVLQDKDWVVHPIVVITGAQFWINYEEGPELHCLEDYDLLCKAAKVGLSERYRKSDPLVIYTVAKLWYSEK